MRRFVTPERLRQFMNQLAAAVRSPGRGYFAGGATALLLGLREQTIDINLRFDPEPQGVFEAIARLKESLEVNVEMTSPDQFIPCGINWRDRSSHIATIGQLQFFHFDLALQALARIERGHRQDLEDVRAMVCRGFVTSEGLRHRFHDVEGGLLRYPSIDPRYFKKQLADFLEYG